MSLGNAAPIRSVAPASLATGQQTVLSTATLIVAARQNRRGVLIISGSAVVLYLGDSTVSSSTGLRIPAVEGASIMIPTELALYGVVASGSMPVSYMELF